MHNYDFSKKELYEQNILHVPSYKTVYFIQRIKLLEDIFSLHGVTAIKHLVDVDICNMGDSYHYMPAISISTEIQVSGENINNEELIPLTDKLRLLDEEICQMISEDNCTAGRDEVEIKVYEQLEAFLIDQEVSKEQRKELYKSEGPSFFKSEILSDFNEFIESLINNQTYFSPVKVAYDVSFEVIPLSDQNLHDIYIREKEFKRTLIMSYFEQYLDKLSTEKELDFNNDIILINTDNDLKISFSFQSDPKKMPTYEDKENAYLNTGTIIPTHKAEHLDKNKNQNKLSLKFLDPANPDNFTNLYDNERESLYLNIESILKNIGFNVYSQGEIEAIKNMCTTLMIYFTKKVIHNSIDIIPEKNIFNNRI